MSDIGVYSSLNDIPGESGQDHIRLLTLAPSHTSWADPIHVSLSVVRLSSEPVYEALSYSWGIASDPDRETISVDGRPFLVRPNLENALRRLRRRDGVARVLWIDALCINQDDLAERAYQVTLMEQIYRLASRVVVWLGNDAASSSTVLPLCQRMVEVWQPLIEDETFDFNDPEAVKHNDQKPFWLRKLREAKARQGRDPHDVMQEELRDKDRQFATQAEIISTFSLLRWPWFSRCWVLQEACLAQEAIVQCGVQTISWPIFCMGVTLVMNIGDGKQPDRARQEDFMNSNLLLTTMVRNKLQYGGNVGAEHIGKQPLDLLWLLRVVRSLKATDPRDKVYAVLGLVDAEDLAQMEAVRPDYSISVAECYKRTALAIMSHKKNLDILLTDRNPESVLGLPSWVPDWVDSQTSVPTSFADAQGKYQAFHASGLGDLDMIGRRVEGDVLRLPGHVFDSVVAVEGILTVPRVDQSDLKHWYTSMDSFKYFWKHGLGGIGQYLDTLLAWERLALSRYHPTYPTGEDPETAFAMTLCTGRADSPETALAEFRQWRKGLTGPKALSYILPSSSSGARNEGYSPFVALSAIVTTAVTTGGDKTFTNGIEKTLYRRLARTQRGFLAVVPAQTVVGDQVSLFRGCKMPLITRAAPRRGGGLELVGPSFVHGIMHGEGWDQRSVRDIAIV